MEYEWAERFISDAITDGFQTYWEQTLILATPCTS